MSFKPLKIPWLLKVCPEHYKPMVVKIGCLVGAVGWMVFLWGGLLAMLIGPLAMARYRPKAPISAQINWLREQFPGDYSLLCVYSLIVFAIALIFLVGIQIMLWARFGRESKHPAE